MKKAWIVFCEESSSMLNGGPCYNRIFFGKQKFQVERLLWLSTDLPKGNSLNGRTFASHYARAGPQPMVPQSLEKSLPACSGRWRQTVRLWVSGVKECLINVCFCQPLCFGSKTLGTVKIRSVSCPLICSKINEVMSFRDWNSRLNIMAWSGNTMVIWRTQPESQSTKIHLLKTYWIPSYGPGTIVGTWGVVMNKIDVVDAVRCHPGPPSGMRLLGVLMDDGPQVSAFWGLP